MSQKIGILYSTVDGQTLKICQRISGHLQAYGHACELAELGSFDQQVTDYDFLIIGASIRYGKHNKKVLNFIKKHHKPLSNIKTAFFSVNLVARKEAKNTCGTNPYVVKFFKQINWHPDICDVFAGVLDYDSYSPLDRFMIRLIMKMTDGPTHTDGPMEFTNWQRVKEFSKKVSLMIEQEAEPV
ncbi:menaquinone-dependent protoporphyrinogen IX dehydrogenase [Fulvivirga maritima]|uniref:menaquinone-dependent protoporphyrinogen IX dehydrogenase n=1 Tax=Fulvivirga maritima TaxID=2904247 RepID=UPI001F41BE5B|nr:menaquinone-dependent protoporphyrinogen IX dehydrogenase [Fulvivirga maritima]UII28791.1 menaquinone-dependent protoporphyrinogen IX dehydrogenase [Fulvivirga maritima]